jgi:succinoglycan biosynthesis transport protein ExoP
LITPNSSQQIEQLVSSEEEDAIDFLGIARRRKWIIILCTIVGLGLGGLYFVQEAPTYRSSCQLLVIDKGLRQRLPVNESSSEIEKILSDKVLSTHAVLITSPELLRKAYRNVEERGVQSVKSAGDISGGLEVIIGGPEAFKSADVLTITFEGPDAEDCQQVIVAVIDAYQTFLRETYNNASLDKIGLITDAKDELLVQLTDKEREWREFRSKAPILLRGENGSNPHLERLARLEESRSEAFVKAAETQSRLQSMSHAIEKGISREALLLMVRKNASLVESGALRESNNRIETTLLPFKVDLAIIKEQYGVDHPQVRAIEKKMRLTQQFLEQQESINEENKPEKIDFLETYQAALKQELVEIEFQNQVFSDMYEKERIKVKELEIYETRNESYNRELDRIKGLFNASLQALQELNLVRDYGGYETKILAKPGRGYQVAPKLPIVLSIAGMAGMLSGCLLAFLIDTADKSFRNPDEIRKHLGLPIVGHIPAMNFGEIRKALRTEGETDTPKIDASVVTYHRPKSRQSESYRAIRTSLYFNNQGEKNKVIQITSPNPGDGKTTLVSNLAVAIAQSGKSILLIDSDVRRPRLHRIFGCKSSIGLTSAISGEVDLNTAIQTTGVPNLTLLACGPKPPNPAELLCSPNFAEILEQAREQYDYVIIDTPPLLAVTDASVVAARADGIMLTMRISKHSRPNTLRAVEQLKEVGGKIHGIVVNGVGKGSSSYGAGRYAGSQYRYGSYYYQYSDAYMYGDQYARYYTSEDGSTPQVTSIIEDNGTKETE